MDQHKIPSPHLNETPDTSPWVHESSNAPLANLCVLIHVEGESGCSQSADLLYLRDLDLRAIPTETNWGKYFHDLLGVINLQAVHCDDWNFLVFRKLKLSF